MNVHVAHLANHASDVGALDSAVTLHRLRGRGAQGYFTSALEVRKLARQLRPDVINAHYVSGYGTLATLSGVAPLVAAAWGSDVFEFPDRNWVARALVTATLRRADAVWSSSYVMADRIRTLADRPVDVIAYGVDRTHFAPADPHPAHAPFRFGIVKTLAPHYRIDVLLAAFAHYLNRAGQRAATLTIAGTGPEEERLKRMAADLHITEQVAWLGAVPHPEVPDLLRNLDCFVLTSETESFGVAAVEAMACGLPVIASDAPGFVEVLDHGRYGILVPRADATALASAMGQVASNKSMQRELSASSLDRASEYDWEACLDEAVALLERSARR